MIPLVFVLEVSASENNYLSIGVGQTEFNYFADGQSPIQPNSESISYARHFSDTWLLELNHQRIKGDGQWLLREGEILDIFNQAETNVSSTGLSVLWQGDSFGLSFSYDTVDTNDESITFVPRLLERISSDDDILSVSFEKTIEFESKNNPNQWSLDWGIGTQYTDSNLEIIDTVGLQPLTDIISNIDQSTLSGFVDLDLSYWMKETSFSWSPYLAVSWNWEVSSSGEELVLISRSEQQRIVDSPSGIFTNSYRIPDSGSMDVGVSVLWDSG